MSIGLIGSRLSPPFDRIVVTGADDGASLVMAAIAGFVALEEALGSDIVVQR